MKHFAIFGNPIRHTQSPYIHNLFSLKTGILLSYKKFCSPLEDFEKNVFLFFSSKGNGANVTVPFKERAFQLCNRLTLRAYRSRSVNVIKKKCGSIWGDNTDGIGLVQDLKRLKMLKKRVLLIGAGGAAKGTAYSLLQNGCSITITNRTFFRAKHISSMYKNFGSIRAIPIKKLKKEKFDLIVNATSSGIDGKVPSFPTSLIHSTTRCYDMFYANPFLNKKTPFIKRCQRLGSKHCADGLGMLVEQAAYSFLFWNGILPETRAVIQQIRSE